MSAIKALGVACLLAGLLLTSAPVLLVAEAVSKYCSGDFLNFNSEVSPEYQLVLQVQDSVGDCSVYEVPLLDFFLGPVFFVVGAVLLVSTPGNASSGTSNA